jgi:hypothetical protein
VSEHPVKRGGPEGAHLVEGDVHNLSFLARVVDVICIYGLVAFCKKEQIKTVVNKTYLNILTESLELVNFAAQRLGSSEWVGGLDLVNQDSVGVDLTDVVGLLQVVPGDLVVRRDVVAASQPTDSQINVGNARVHVYKHDVVVEYENIEHEECHFGQEGDE